MTAPTASTAPAPADAPTDAPHPTATPRRRPGPWWPWVATTLAFPPAGYLGHQLVDAVDGVGAAAVSGVVTGAVIGAAQWVVLRRRGASPRWVAATSVGLGVGLAAGSAAVGYATSLGALAVMGAVCGLVVGAAQAASLPALRRRALAWTLSSAALWALGWAVTTAAGVSVDQQFPVFGLSGALVVALAQSVVVDRLVPAGASTDPA